MINSNSCGIGLGTLIAVIISYFKWKSIGWMIVHGLLGWFYVIYYVIKYGWVLIGQMTEYNTGLGFTGALTILFIALKLLHTIDWSWWIVLSPVLISAGIGLVIFLVALILITMGKIT